MQAALDQPDFATFVAIFTVVVAASFLPFAGLSLEVRGSGR